MEDMNLHFTGDFHAITSAHNLLSAMIDNHIYWGSAMVDILSGTPMDKSDIAKNIVRVFKMESRKNGIAMAYYQEKCNSMKEGKKGNK